MAVKVKTPTSGGPGDPDDKFAPPKPGDPSDDKRWPGTEGQR